MRNIISKKEKGITLIALVITIIVLLILAGVAIAMLSGENGILNKSAEAKTKYEEAQKSEESRIIDYEITTDLVSNNTTYKFNNGYLTGLRTATEKDATNVKSVNEKLPDGYEIFSYNKEINAYELAKDDELIKTGMVIKKNGEKVGEAIVYGDLMINGPTSSDFYCADGKITASEASYMNILVHRLDNKMVNIEKIAGDVNHDNIIDWKDVKRITAYNRALNKPDKWASLINQNVPAQSADSIRVENCNESKKNYVNSLESNIKSNFEWKEDEENYLCTIESTTVKTVLESLPGAAIVRNSSILGEEETLTDGDKIMLYPDFETKSSSDMLEIGQIKIQQ